MEINKKRKTSFNQINVYNGVIPIHKNFSCTNIYHHKDCNPKNFYPPESDVMSFDTHEMKIGDECRMSNINVFTGMRKSLNLY
jgi:hypothetical protein